MIKRFIVFGGNCYYACGGFFDFRDAFDTLKEAQDFAFNKRNAVNYSEAIEWYHIFDIETKTIVERSDTNPYPVIDSPVAEYYPLFKNSKEISL